MNVRKVQYVIDEDAQGNEVISIFDPSALMKDKNNPDAGHPEKTILDVEKEVKRLENPDNF